MNLIKTSVLMTELQSIFYWVLRASCFYQLKLLPAIWSHQRGPDDNLPFLIFDSFYSFCQTLLNSFKVFTISFIIILCLFLVIKKLADEINRFAPFLLFYNFGLAIFLHKPPGLKPLVEGWSYFSFTFSRSVRILFV